MWGYGHVHETATAYALERLIVIVGRVVWADGIHMHLYAAVTLFQIAGVCVDGRVLLQYGGLLLG